MLNFREGVTTLFDSPAREVIALVVGACCAKADECQGGFTNIAAVLRHTFLPTPTKEQSDA
ncbi:MAG: hypothetical protein WC869_11775 [Phycisphaerae bacterium]